MTMMLCPRCWNKTRPCDKCRGVGKIDDVRLSNNFLLSELLASPTAVEKGISNDPTPLEFKSWRPPRAFSSLLGTCWDLSR